MNLLSLLFVTVIGLAIALSFFLSPQKTEPLLNSNGEILEGFVAEIRGLTLNGVCHRVLILGKDASKPNY